MNYFEDLLFLFVYGLSAIFFTEISTSFVLAFLFALILICACYFMESPSARLIMCILYLLPAVFFPEFFSFYPAVLYLLLRDERRMTALACTLCYLYYTAVFQNRSPLQIFWGCIAFALAYLLQKRTQMYQTLNQKYRDIQDDSRERNLLLSEKNQTLLEKQNSEIYAATLRERNRIAREIHDNVGHVLSRSILLVGALKAVNDSKPMTPMLENLDISLNSAMDSIRSSVHDLHDESVNLEESIHGIIREFTFCPVHLTYDMSRQLPKEIKYCFISITQEALSNIIKHSNASHVEITMREHPALYQLCIEDNGSPTFSATSGTMFSGDSGTAFSGTSNASLSRTSGIIRPDTSDPPRTDSRRGIGLANMQERTRSLNGTFQIQQENGFKIFITIPKTAKEYNE